MQRILALVFIIVLSPILIMTGLFILLMSGAPVIFRQKRVGKGKKSFTVYKFRTMRDNQITLIGKVLRKTGIDELPQLLNIVRGDMAFVGPRPLTHQDIVRLGWDVQTYSSRWSVLPGITGMAQLVNVCDKNVTWENDQYYVQNKSVNLDLSIIWKSLLIPIFWKGQSQK